MQFRGREYELIRASDVGRDGMWMECNALDDPGVQPVVAVFYSDTDGTMTFSAYRADLPLDLIEWVIAAAREGLPPIEKKP